MFFVGVLWVWFKIVELVLYDYVESINKNFLINDDFVIGEDV